MAIATLWALGFPAASSRLMFAATTFLLDPLLRGIDRLLPLPNGFGFRALDVLNRGRGARDNRGQRIHLRAIRHWTSTAQSEPCARDRGLLILLLAYRPRKAEPA